MKYDSFVGLFFIDFKVAPLWTYNHNTERYWIRIITLNDNMNALYISKKYKCVEWFLCHGIVLSSHSNTCLVACYFHEVCFLQTVSIVNQWVARNRTNYISKSCYKLWSSCLYAMCQLKCDIYWCHSFLLLMLLLWLEYMHTKRFMISTYPNKGNNRHYVRTHIYVHNPSLKNLNS